MYQDSLLPKTQTSSPAILFVGDHNSFSDIYLRLIAEEFGHYRVLCDRRLDQATRRIITDGHDIDFVIICCRFGPPALSALHDVITSFPAIHPVLAYDSLRDVRAVLTSANDYAPFRRLSFLPMKAKVDAVISILHLLISGECHVSSDVMKMLLADQAANQAAAPSADLAADIDRLTAREAQVLSFLAKGEPNKTIAQDLDLSPSTVKLHIHHIIAKLGVRNRTEAAIAYIAAQAKPHTRAAR